MTPPEIRPASPDDTTAVCSVWYQGWHDAHASIAPAPLTAVRTMASFEERMARMLDQARVAVLEGAVVGFSVCIEAEVDQFYVAPVARGTGIAALLLADAEAVIAARGFDVAHLKCGIGNDRAARFYAKHGWQQTSTVRALLDTTDGPYPLDVWRFEKRLA